MAALTKLDVCQGFTSRTPVRVRDGSLPKGLNKYPAQLPRLGQLRTRVGSKSLVMQDYKWLPRLITALEYFGNLRREMSQVQDYKRLPRLITALEYFGNLRREMSQVQDYKRLPWLITAPEYFRNLRREMSQVATWTFNVLYYFPLIWFNGSHYPRSYI